MQSSEIDLAVNVEETEGDVANVDCVQGDFEICLGYRRRSEGLY